QKAGTGQHQFGWDGWKDILCRHQQQNTDKSPFSHRLHRLDDPFLHLFSPFSYDFINTYASGGFFMNEQQYRAVTDWARRSPSRLRFITALCRLLPVTLFVLYGLYSLYLL